ncbi:hypothetical protein [Lentzea kentuckyensis]|uniref:hypothetical protein n=1 Tax=Lentzea kentuckyensis TaxID=360086 RepID=UPI000A3C3F39|nr:hypothetical protein [Lentzea kentuckyensis]
MSKYPTFNEFLDTVRNPDQIERARAVRTVAHHATDATDLATLMDILGLTASDITPAPSAPPEPPAPLRAHAVQKRMRRGSTRLS